MKKETEDIATFGEIIRSLREERELSLREVSEKTKIDISLLGKIERDERKPTSDQLKKLSKFYNYNHSKLQLELMTDYIAYQILDEEMDSSVFKVAEKKFEYLKGKD